MPDALSWNDVEKRFADSRSGHYTAPFMSERVDCGRYDWLHEDCCSTGVAARASIV